MKEGMLPALPPPLTQFRRLRLYSQAVFFKFTLFVACALVFCYRHVPVCNRHKYVCVGVEKLMLKPQTSWIMNIEQRCSLLSICFDRRVLFYVSYKWLHNREQREHESDWMWGNSGESAVETFVSWYFSRNRDIACHRKQFNQVVSDNRAGKQGHNSIIIHVNDLIME